MSWIVEERIAAWCYVAMGAIGIGMAGIVLSGCSGAGRTVLLASGSVGAADGLVGAAVVAAGLLMLRRDPAPRS